MVKLKDFPPTDSHLIEKKEDEGPEIAVFFRSENPTSEWRLITFLTGEELSAEMKRPGLTLTFSSSLTRKKGKIQ